METNQSTTGATSMDTAAQLADLKQQVSAALTSADTQGSDTVQNLQFIHKARLSSQTRAAARAAAQYGADSTQAKQAQAAVTATKNTIARISVLHQQLTTAPPQAAPTGWVLHGRVFNAQLQAVSDYTVFLVDSTKTYQQAYGFAYTDKTGYFVLNYAGTAKSGLGQPQSSAAAQQLFLEVANAKGLPVYLSTAAVQPAAGSVTYQNIVLPAVEQPIGEPPEAIRKIALPPKEG